MSNFHPTVGRNVQYIDVNRVIRAAIITSVDPNGFVGLAVFSNDTVEFKSNVKLYIEGATYEQGKQVNVCKLIWQNR
jgi:hypothetical protein